MHIPNPDTAEVWLVPPLLAGITLAIGLFLDWIFPVFVLTVLMTGYMRITVGLVLMAAGGALAIVAECQFHRLGTPVPP